MCPVVTLSTSLCIRTFSLLPIHMILLQILGRILLSSENISYNKILVSCVPTQDRPKSLGNGPHPAATDIKGTQREFIDFLRRNRVNDPFTYNK